MAKGKNRNAGLNNKTVQDLIKALTNLNVSLGGIGNMGSSGGKGIVLALKLLKDIKQAIIDCCIETNGSLGKMKGGGGAAGPSDKEKAEKDKWEKFLSFFNEGKLLGVLNNLDKLQQRALATNTNLEQIQVTKGLGIRMSEMVKSLLELRELGFRKVSDSTQQLISTMKMTNQSTAGLNKFLAKNSYYLNLSNSQSQELVTSLAKTGQTFGMSQEKTIEALNAVLATTKNVASFVGDGGPLTASITRLIQETGGRNAEEIQRAVGMLFDVNNETLMRISGQTESVSRLLAEADPAKGAMILRQILSDMKTFSKSILPTGTDRNMMNPFMRMSESLGGLANLQSLDVAVKALEENTQVAGKIIQDSSTFRTAEEAFYNKMETVLVNLNNTLLKISPGIIGGVGAVAGGAAVGGGLMKGAGSLLSKLGSTALAGSFAGPVGTAVGAIAGLGFALYDIYQDSAEQDNLQAELAAKSLNHLKSIDTKTIDPNQGDKSGSTAIGLAKIISNQIQQLGPGDGAALQAKSIGLFQEMINKLDGIMNNTVKSSTVSRPQSQLLPN
jgi:hypothetical protein